MIGVFDMKTIIKKEGRYTITITYNDRPSAQAIHNYAQKIKNTIDIKVPAS